MANHPPWLATMNDPNKMDPAEARRALVVPLGTYAGNEMQVRAGVFPGG